MGSKINFKVVQKQVRILIRFLVMLLIDFGIPFGVQNEAKTVLKFEQKMDLVLERLPPAGIGLRAL